MVCSYFLCLTGLVFGDCIFLKICPFLLGFSCDWGIVNCSPLCFCHICCTFSFFNSDFIHWALFHLSFFPWWVWLKVYQFCLSSQRTNKLLYSLIFAIIFFISLSFISALQKKRSIGPKSIFYFLIICQFFLFSIPSN